MIVSFSHSNNAETKVTQNIKKMYAAKDYLKVQHQIFLFNKIRQEN